MDKIKIVLADDHPLIREGFKALLNRDEGFEIIGEAETGIELIEMMNKISPEIILADISMPRLNGLHAIEQIKNAHPSVKFIILTMHEEREYVMSALKMGIDGYLLKNVERAELMKAIRTVYKGDKYFSPHITSILAQSVTKTDQPELADVTPREKEVLDLVAAGLSTKQIADKLDISVRTVESHRINMLKKLRVNNSAELIRKAIELKIIG